MSDWSIKAKRLVKSELVKRGISNSHLADLLTKDGTPETKASIDSKISRGTFSASFLLQCLHVIGCEKIELEYFESQVLIAAEPNTEYNSSK